jgi:hypothetical protein
VIAAHVQRAIGPRAATRLARKYGGTPLYVSQAKRNCAEVKAPERAAMLRLFECGYTIIEIARVTGRSSQSVCAPWPHRWRRSQSADVKVERALVRDEAARQNRAHLVEQSRVAHAEYLLDAAATADRLVASRRYFGCSDESVQWAADAAQTLKESAADHLRVPALAEQEAG